jgi:hypothetical protein
MARMTRRSRTEIYALMALLVILALALYGEFGSEATLGVFQPADVPFHPLGITDPTLRLDLLARLGRQEYKGPHRNIFSEAPLPPPQTAKIVPAAQQQPAAPPVPSGPPPLVVPATFFGIVTDINSGKMKAVFSGSENDVYVVPEGGILMGQYRVDKIGPNTVDLEEISSGRKATLTLAPPVQNSMPSQGQP